MEVSISGKNKGLRVNRDIRVPEVRLIGDQGEAMGVVSIERARAIAEEKGLDLIEVSPNAKPPVVKVIDYGKYKYQQQKKASEAKKKQVIVQLKEIKLRPNIEEHDLNVKLKKVYQFIDQGDKVKLLMQFRGREMAHKQIGLDKFDSIIKMIIERGGAQVESAPKMMGYRSIAMLGPIKKK